IWGGNGLSPGKSYNPVTDAWTDLGSAGEPARTIYGTAVWTGSRMIVWGGQSADVVNTGGIYDPAALTWSSTPGGLNLPSARTNHTAVWTGSEMIVWGGATDLTSSRGTNTGGRLNPSTSSWLPTALGPAIPVGRYWSTSVWTGSEMIVWGGTTPVDTNSGGRYSPVTDAWIPTSTVVAPSARSQHAAVWTGSNMVVWG